MERIRLWKGHLMRNYVLIVLVLVTVSVVLVVTLGREDRGVREVSPYYPLPEKTHNPQETVTGKELNRLDPTITIQ